jgi:uncharacterized protein (DUF427 family)
MHERTHNCVLSCVYKTDWEAERFCAGDLLMCCLQNCVEREWARTMAKAVWNGKVIAESETTETVEGNVYFPESSVNREYLRASSTTSTCPWKGQARYYSLMVDGQENQDAAWYYPDPKPAARNVKNHMAFWRGVEIEK